MEHPSPGSSLGTRTKSPRAFEGTTTGKIRQWPVKSYSGPIKSTNAHARVGINRMPPELLSKIFLVCVALWPTQDQDDYFVAVQPRGPSPGDFTCGDHLPWIAIAQVCQYWRSVALGCGELWRELLFSSPEATKEMLRRSKGVTLIVKAQGGFEPAVSENVRMVIPDIWRASVLHLCFPARDLQPLLHDISLAFPNLESLRLCSRSVHDLDFALDHFEPPFHIPDTIFTRNAPSLRLLELTHCKISWRSLLIIFHGVPMLDTLILDQALPTHIPNDTSSDIASPMQFPPHLRMLTLGGSMDSCTNQLARFIYPIATNLTLKCRMFSRDNPNFYSFLQRAHSAVRYGSGDHIIQSLGVGIIHNPRRLVLRCLVASRSSAPTVPSPPLPHLNVMLSQEEYGEMPVTELIQAAAATLPLAEVQNLYVLGQWRSDVDWSQFLQRLPKIHTIHFQHGFPSELIKVLAEGRDNAQPVTVLLPNLRSLWLNGVSFRILWGGPEWSLVACLQSRFQAGFAIQDLHLTDCWNLYEEDVEKMSALVYHVDWDGVEQAEEDYDPPETSDDFEGIYDSD